jgi:hypothetical protein
LPKFVLQITHVCKLGCSNYVIHFLVAIEIDLYIAGEYRQFKNDILIERFCCVGYINKVCPASRFP